MICFETGLQLSLISSIEESAPAADHASALDRTYEAPPSRSRDCHSGAAANAR
jgi:hypothetical protein